MYFAKAFLFLATAAAVVSANPAVNERAGSIQRRDDCGNTLGDCYANDCTPWFQYPSDTTGKCTAGEYNGCPCEKCGGGVGYVGSCTANGCDGRNGKCTAGQYDGCQCN